MKKFICILFLSCFVYQFASAQLPNGSKAPNFTITDINGTSHQLYDVMGQNKVVFIDFFATWCGNCWNYHQSHALQTIFTQYGPTGTNQAQVYAIEADPNTSVQCITNSAGCVGSTAGNWTTGITYPTADNSAVASQYNVTAYPTILFICPTDTTVYNMGTKNATTAWAQAQSWCSSLTSTAPQASVTSTTNVKCKGTSTGAINVTVSGNGPFTFLWNTGATSEDLINIAAGTYSLTVTNSTGLTTSLSSIVITEPTLALMANSTAQNPSCTVNGSATTSATGGTGAYTYLWSNGQTSAQASNLSAGAYHCTVSDMAGCTAMTSVQLSAPSPPIAQATASHTLTCIQPTTQLQATGSSTGSTLSYGWQGPGIVGTSNGFGITANTPGAYTLVVTDNATGCTASSLVSVQANTTIPTVSIATPLALTCAQTSTTLQATSLSTSPYSLQWATQTGTIASGSTTNMASVTAPGTYTVQIQDNASGCTSVAMTTVTADLNPPIINIPTPATLGCQTNAFVALQASVMAQNAPTSVLWMNALGTVVGTSLTLNVSQLGTYKITATNQTNGCTAMATAQVNAAPAISLAASNIVEPSCHGQATGSISVAASGGIGAFTYKWNTGQTSTTLQNLVAGTYIVTATDSQNCTKTQTINLNEPAALGLNIDATGISGVGMSDGTAQVTVTGGTGAHSYLWSTGASTASLQNLSAGTYTVTVTDANSCTQSASVVVNAINCALTSSISAQNISCHGMMDGQASIQIQGGAAPYLYLWSNTMATPTISNLGPGTYVCSYTDANGCPGTKSVVISQPNQMQVSLQTSTNVQCPNDATGALSISVTGGTGNLSYNWSNGSTASGLSSAVAGTYAVVVTDANGCSKLLTDLVIQAIDTEKPSITAPQSIDLELGTSPSIQLTAAVLGIVATDNCGTPTLSISPISLDCSNIGPNLIDIVALDGNGNLSLKSITVNIEDLSPPSISCPDSKSVCFGNTPVFYAAPTVMDNCVQQTVLQQTSGLASGAVFPAGSTIQSFVVEDGGGNTAACSFTVTVNGQMQVQANTQAATCANTCDGSATLTVMGGTAPYSYSSIGNFPTGLCSGTYTVTITDASACSVVESFVITEPIALGINLLSTTNDIGNMGQGSISVAASGGNAPFTYNWKDAFNTNYTGATLTGLFMGEYTLTVIDAAGCTFTYPPIRIDNTVNNQEPNWMQSISLMPNPSKGFVYLSFSARPTTDLHLQVMDWSGKLLQSSYLGTKSSHNLDLSKYGSGIYLVRISNAFGAVVRLVVVE